LLALWLAACGADDGACRPGTLAGCRCDGARVGTRVCGKDGAYGLCVCADLIQSQSYIIADAAHD
jgi:hypothetical protein